MNEIPVLKSNPGEEFKKTRNEFYDLINAKLRGEQRSDMNHGLSILYKLHTIYPEDLEEEILVFGRLSGEIYLLHPLRMINSALKMGITDTHYLKFLGGHDTVEERIKAKEDPQTAIEKVFQCFGNSLTDMIILATPQNSIEQEEWEKYNSRFSLENEKNFIWTYNRNINARKYMPLIFWEKLEDIIDNIDNIMIFEKKASAPLKKLDQIQWMLNYSKLIPNPKLRKQPKLFGTYLLKYWPQNTRSLYQQRAENARDELLKGLKQRALNDNEVFNGLKDRRFII